ncbi:MAG: fumarylacetoacetate hydrolase family protein [Bacteroidales bacterium]|nr:fumarylacetoacetate hydrolase family protein [Bacteroidales bacterium]
MKIICLAKNYADHAAEFDAVVPEEPIFFLKPDSALLIRNRPFYYPDFSKNVHYELELVVRIDRLGKGIQERFAHKYYSEVALGIDFTARDLQAEAKRSGNPWTLAKGFDYSAAVSEFVPLQKLGKPIDQLHFHLLKNGEQVQTGDTSQMLFGVDRIIASLSQYMTLRTGDYIFTGTPAGVGPVQIGDVLEGFLEDIPLLKCRVK